MYNDISNFAKTWVSTKLKFTVVWNNNKRCFKSDRGSVALKKNTWGIPRNIRQAPKMYTFELNCQNYRRLKAILYIQLLKSYVIVIIPCTTLYNLSILGQWVNNYRWEYFGCSSNCLAPNVTIFTKMQFSGNRINIFTLFFSIYFLGINHTMITNFWHNREKLTWLFYVVKKMAHKSHWLCVQKLIAWKHPLHFINFFHILQVWFYYQNEQNEGVSHWKIPILFLVNQYSCTLFPAKWNSECVFNLTYTRPISY